jgi:hypothetical protein
MHTDKSKKAAFCFIRAYRRSSAASSDYCEMLLPTLLS